MRTLGQETGSQFLASPCRRPSLLNTTQMSQTDRQDGDIVAKHSRCFGRNQTIYDPWHYVPVLARKPGAPRNGAPFKDWVLPGAVERVRRKLAAVDDGDRQMVNLLSAVLTDGLAAVEAACGEALRDGVHSSNTIINILARRREPTAPITILTPDALRLRHEPAADCAHYDSLEPVSVEVNRKRFPRGRVCDSRCWLG
jgi:hypothetical protein